MHRRLWRTMITGGIVGAAVGMLLSPQFRPTARQRMMKAGGTIARGAKRLMKRAREASTGLMEK